METKHTKHTWVKVPQRIISLGERMQAYRLLRQQSIKAAQQAKRNKRLSKADKLAIEAQLSSPEND